MDYLEMNLKHYDKYLNKLTVFANSLGYYVVYRLEESDGLFVPSNRRIVLDKELSEANTVAVFLHELGHAFQHYFKHIKKAEYARLERAYTAKRPTKAQEKLTLAYEKEAWEIGKLIAAVLKIKLGTWYDEIARYYVTSHKASKN